MPLTTLDPKPALIVIDLQKGLAGTQTAHPFADVVARAASLARVFRGCGLPVVLVNVTDGAPGRTELSRPSIARPADWTEILDELDPQPSDHRVTKTRWGAFYGTGLDDLLRDLDVTQVVVVGVATSAGVESTARAAHEHGYHVVLGTDAMTDRDVDAHDNSVRRIFPKLGETALTAEIIGMLPAVR